MISNQQVYFSIFGLLYAGIGLAETQSYGRTMSLQATMNTIAKYDLKDANELSDSDKCLIRQNTYLNGQIVAEVDGYFKIQLTDPTKVCGFKSAFIHSGHVDVKEVSETDKYYDEFGNWIEEDPFDTGSFGIPGCRGGAYAVGFTLTTSTGGCALASLIGNAEGTYTSYHYLFNFVTFDPYSANDHPRRTICASGYCSSAAGRYQIKISTWDTVVKPRTYVRDFTPQSQDEAAAVLLQYRGVSYDSVMSYTSFQQAIKKIANEWASLPGSPYGQPKISLQTAWSYYQQYTR